MLKVDFHDTKNVPDGELKYVVTVARHLNRWVFCRHKDQNTWELPGGYRAPSEKAINAAFRRLSEEAGVAKAKMYPISAFSFELNGEVVYGMLYFAEAWAFAKSSDSEDIEEVALLCSLPDELTYPDITLYLFAYAKSYIKYKIDLAIKDPPLHEEFRKAWNEELKPLGGGDMKGYSKDHPLRILEESLEKEYITPDVCEYNAERYKQGINMFFEEVGDVVDTMMVGYAEKRGISVRDLSDGEVARIISYVMDYYFRFKVGQKMEQLKVPEIIDILKEYATEEDFSGSISGKHDKIDFDRKWNHTRTAVGAMLSLDAMTEAGEEFCDTSTNGETAVQSIDYIESFIATLDEPKDKKIVRMLLDGKKQERIAKELGYSSQSAVSKRIKQIREQLTEYRKKH